RVSEDSGEQAPARQREDAETRAVHRIARRRRRPLLGVRETEEERLDDDGERPAAGPRKELRLEVAAIYDLLAEGGAHRHRDPDEVLARRAWQECQVLG